MSHELCHQFCHHRLVRDLHVINTVDPHVYSCGYRLLSVGLSGADSLGPSLWRCQVTLSGKTEPRDTFLNMEVRVCPDGQLKRVDHGFPFKKLGQ